MSLPVRTTPEADAQIREVDGWWRANRPASPNLFAQELAASFDTISHTPNIGRLYRRPTVQGTRRVLLQGTRYHVYIRPERGRSEGACSLACAPRRGAAASRVVNGGYGARGQRVGSKFRGEIQVVVRLSDGSTFLDRRFGPETLDHVMPYNYGDTKLASLPLEASRIRPWTVAVRVTRADPQFAGVRSEVKLWRDRPDPGMGGVLTYVLIIPAIMLLLLAVFFSFEGSRTETGRLRGRGSSTI